MKQGWPRVVRGHPGSIGVGDLVVGLGDWASFRPVRKRAGLPVPILGAMHSFASCIQVVAQTS
jgi:hypothetical protein